MSGLQESCAGRGQVGGQYQCAYAYHTQKTSERGCGCECKHEYRCVEKCRQSVNLWKV